VQFFDAHSRVSRPPLWHIYVSSPGALHYLLLVSILLAIRRLAHGALGGLVIPQPATGLIDPSMECIYPVFAPQHIHLHSR